MFSSTLQSVQAAVDHQLGEFAKSQPNTKISLVTFNNEVTVFGDGKNDAVIVTGDKLNHNDALVKVGTEASLPASIKETRESLSSKLFRYNAHSFHIMIKLLASNTHCYCLSMLQYVIVESCSVYFYCKLLFYSLEESGSTALGPALITSIAMAARVPGSRVSSVLTVILVMCISATEGGCVH